MHGCVEPEFGPDRLSKMEIYRVVGCVDDLLSQVVHIGFLLLRKRQFFSYEFDRSGQDAGDYRAHEPDPHHLFEDSIAIGDDANLIFALAEFLGFTSSRHFDDRPGP
ncbi:MAG: hypothetical protein E6Q76_14470 [Rhizobium sp.]|nr:MAG: hypothetical protein E6Q76_14470 [Rhizobium sp.]